MKLFLDDERYPPSGFGWLIARQMADFQIQIRSNGNAISVISFDHDLGESSFHEVPTGLDCAKWLADFIMDGNRLPQLEEIYIHSGNPPGAKNIRDFFLSFQKAGYLKDIKIKILG